MTRGRVLGVVLGLVVVVLLALGATLGRRAVTPSPPTPPPAATSATPPGWVEFRDPRAGFGLAHPPGWRRLRAGDPQVVLLASRGPQASLQVRVVPLGVAVGPRELPAVKPVTDKIVTSGKTVRLLAPPKPIELAGLPGYFYLYSFGDPAAGATGVHSHYFLFKGQEMITLVFQSAPPEQFGREARVFDEIAATFHVQ